MANTRTSTKRARQAIQRQSHNQTIRSATRSSLRGAMDSLSKKEDSVKTKAAYVNAVKALSKAASKGAIPKRRAARKISRLTRLAKKTAPAVFAAASAK